MVVTALRALTTLGSCRRAVVSCTVLPIKLTVSTVQTCIAITKCAVVFVPLISAESKNDLPAQRTRLANRASDAVTTSPAYKGIIALL